MGIVVRRKTGNVLEDAGGGSGTVTVAGSATDALGVALAEDTTTGADTTG
jgi:hypothetical protein